MLSKLRDYLTTRLIMFSGAPTLTREGQFTVKSNGKAYVYYSGAEQELGAGGGGGAPTTAQYLTLTTDATLTQERTLSLTLPLSGSDGGAGAAYTVTLSGWSGTTDGDMLYRNGTAVGSKTPAQARTWLDLASLYQPLDADLTALAALGDGIPVRTSGTWAASTADTVVSDAAGSDGIVVRTAAGSVAARSVASSDGSIIVTNPGGSAGNIDVVVASGLKTIPVYSGFTILLPQGTSLNVDGAGGLTAAGVYGTNVSEADFKCTQLGDAASALCRWYVDAKTRLNEGTIGTDVVFKLGSDISGSTQHYNIGLSSNLSMSTADPTGSRVTISFANGGTNWLLSTKDGTTETDTDTSVAVTASYYYVVRFELTSTSVQVKIGRGSTISAAKTDYDSAGWTVSTSTLPAATTDLYQLISVYRAAGSVNRAILLNYYRCTSQPGWA